MTVSLVKRPKIPGDETVRTMVAFCDQLAREGHDPGAILGALAVGTISMMILGKLPLSWFADLAAGQGVQ